MHRAQGTGHQKELVLALGKTFAKFFSRFGWVGLSRNFAQNLGGSEAKFDSPALSENFAFRSLAPLYSMYVRAWYARGVGVGARTDTTLVSACCLHTDLTSVRLQRVYIHRLTAPYL